MSLIKVSQDGNNLIIPVGVDGKIVNLFYSVKKKHTLSFARSKTYTFCLHAYYLRKPLTVDCADRHGPGVRTVPGCRREEAYSTFKYPSSQHVYFPDTAIFIPKYFCRLHILKHSQPENAMAENYQ
jgi:hypothetical protein